MFTSQFKYNEKPSIPYYIPIIDYLLSVTINLQVISGTCGDRGNVAM